MTVEAERKEDNFGYLRLLQLIAAGKRRLKVSLDFMEGEIRGRSGERFLIDKKFAARTVQKSVPLGDLTIPIRVPAYNDYFLMKLLSARPSDVRDVVALVWKQRIPETRLLVERTDEIIAAPEGLTKKLDVVISDVSDSRFLDSWRGTFITEEFKENDKKRVLRKFRKLKAGIVRNERSKLGAKR